MTLCNRLSIVIPCYNEEETLRTTHEKVSQLLSTWQAQGALTHWELLYVDDGSVDKTLFILKELSREQAHVQVIRFSRNFGHQAALTAGYLHASGDAVASLDADLQDPPEMILEMLKKHHEGYDIVFGARKSRKKDSFLKRFSAEGFYKLMAWLGVRLVFNHADFRLLSRRALEALRHFPESNRFIRGMIPSLGFPQAIVYYDREPRFAGKTKYSLGKMFALAIEGITSFTYLPLRFAAIVGFLTAFGSFGLAIWALFTLFSGRSVPGWTSTVLPLYFLGGIQMLFLGILGEYLGKNYLETKKRPLFIIQETIHVER